MSIAYFDGVIVGGGLVGAALAVALAEQGKEIALLELRPPQLNLQADANDWDARIYAISPANEQFLRHLNAWPDMHRVQPVSHMDVRGDAGGKIEFSAPAIHTSHLTSILENRWLLQAIWQRIKGMDNIKVFSSAAQSLNSEEHAASISLHDGQVLSAPLIMAADGANSWVRAQTDIKVDAKPYHHHGIVANYAIEKPHGNIARQWFKQGDVLAYLPLPQERISIVWSTSQTEALMALSDDAFAERVAIQGEYSLGKLTPIGRRFAFELVLRRPEKMYAPRIALLGDAAHTIHPLAGQGVNLGFGDVMALENILQDAPDWGRSSVLRQYEAERLHAVRSMQMGCDGLFQLFKTEAAPLAWLRNTGLNLVNQMGGIKNQLIRQAMGL